MGGVETVKRVYNSLSLGNRCLSIKPAPGVTKVSAEVLQQIKSLCIIRHQHNPTREGKEQMIKAIRHSAKFSVPDEVFEVLQHGNE